MIKLSDFIYKINKNSSKFCRDALELDELAANER